MADGGRAIGALVPVSTVCISMEPVFLDPGHLQMFSNTSQTLASMLTAPNRVPKVANNLAISSKTAPVLMNYNSASIKVEKAP
jgi:hypothetical protein